MSGEQLVCIEKIDRLLSGIWAIARAAGRIALLDKIDRLPTEYPDVKTCGHSRCQ